VSGPTAIAVALASGYAPASEENKVIAQIASEGFNPIWTVGGSGFDQTWGGDYLLAGLDVPIRGARIFWKGGIGPQVIRVRLYLESVAAHVAEGTVTVDAPGVYECRFATPYTLPSNTAAAQRVQIGCYNTTTPTQYTAILSTTYSPGPVPPYVYGRRCFFLGSVFFGPGEGKPLTTPGTERYLVDLLY